MTPYPDVVEMVQSDLLVKRSTVVVDATGVGGPVVDLLRRSQLGCGVVPVTITSGDGEGSDERGFRVPKRDLITGLQVAFQKRWLDVAARGGAVEAFVQELVATRVRVSESGHARFGARSGHDDLVMAAALAWWRVRRMWPVGGVKGRLV